MPNTNKAANGKGHEWPLLTGGLVCLAWLVLQILFLNQEWIRYGNDSPRYLRAAEEILNGHLPAGKAASYLGYDAFVALFLGIGTTPLTIIIAQMIVSAIAGWCLYRIGTLLYDWRVGLTAASCYLLYPSIQMWNVYLLTESLFVSSVIIALYFVMTAHSGALSSIAAATGSVIFATSVRPHGVVLPIAVVVFVLTSLLWRGERMAVWLIAGVAATLIPVAYILLGRMLEFESPLEHFLSGTVIWGYDALRLDPPDEINPSKWPVNPIAQIALFAAHEPIYFGKLVAAKAVLCLARLRPYYSELHNAVIVLTLAPLYILAIIGIRIRPKVPPARWLLLSLWVLPVLVVSVTFADWDSRHSLVTLPVVFVLAAAGLFRVKDFIRKAQTEKN